MSALSAGRLPSRPVPAAESPPSDSHLCIAAGLNVLAFYVTGVSRVANAWGPGDDAPLSAKVIAVTSLFLWLGVIYSCRMIMYVDVLYTQF